MKKLLLLDGNAMLFRGFYATIYTRPMKTSSNIPTNAIYAFNLMLTKAIELIKPTHIVVAWDAGKPTFRHELNDEYKGTRKQLPEELIAQFPIAREYLEASNIFQHEQVGIEADDIIGSIAKRYSEYEVVILSSDKDLLQLIDDHISVMLMKKGLSEVELIDELKLKEWMGITPNQIIDLKALMGDTADNIKGVPGIGEKTALKLIENYQNIENIYNNLSDFKGKQLEKLTDGKESAFLSKTLATIITDATLNLNEEQFIFNPNLEKLNAFYRKYEFKSFVKESKTSNFELKIVSEIDSKFLNPSLILMLQYDNEHYFEKTCIGVSLSNQKEAVFMYLDDFRKDQLLQDYLKENEVITFNAKLAYHILNNEKIEIKGFKDDILLLSFLVNTSISDYEKMVMQFNLKTHITHEQVFGKKGKPNLVDVEEHLEYFTKEIENLSIIYPKLIQQLKEKNLVTLYQNIELPLIKVLYRMEKQGITTSSTVLEEIGDKTLKIIDEVTQDIYQIVGKEFNLNSPKQLAEVLFDDLGLKTGKKRSTAIDVLEKLEKSHPVISYIIKHRKYQKLYSTYVQGLVKHISNGKIHTTFNQVIAATGRLSSVEPNLQNISAKDEETKEIRKAFQSSKGFELLSFDYSQIELRVIADMANETQMIEDFNQHRDIHSETAKKVFGVEEVDDSMRRYAKAVNFGIIYGMSDFGLSNQLDISIADAKNFIEKYFETYPNIRKFMHQQIEYCKENGYVVTMYQRRREIPEINDSNKMIVEFAKRAAMNTPIQGTAADIIKLAMIEIDKKLENYKTNMILQVHDELVFDCAIEEKEEVYKLIEEAMVNVVQLKVKLEVEGHFGLNYLEVK